MTEQVRKNDPSNDGKGWDAFSCNPGVQESIREISEPGSSFQEYVEGMLMKEGGLESTDSASDRGARLYESEVPEQPLVFPAVDSEPSEASKCARETLEKLFSERRNAWRIAC